MSVKLKKGDIVISPINALDITQGKEYEITDDVIHGNSGIIFRINDDTGFKLVCRLTRCPQIINRNWIIKQ